jgi:ribonuclease HI
MTLTQSEETPIEAWFDGACEPVNPGGHATWGVTVKRGDQIIAEESGHVGYGAKMSNNVAEYAGLLRVLEIVSGMTGPVIIRGDSKLVVQQMQGLWKIKGGLYRSYATAAKDALKHPQLAGRCSFEWIPRDQNNRCDVLSKRELLKRGIELRLQAD